MRIWTILTIVGIKCIIIQEWYQFWEWWRYKLLRLDNWKTFYEWYNNLKLFSNEKIYV